MRFFCQYRFSIAVILISLSLIQCTTSSSLNIAQVPSGPQGNATSKSAGVAGTIGTGAPVSGANVTIKDSHGLVVGTAVADAYGNYNISFDPTKFTAPYLVEAQGTAPDGSSIVLHTIAFGNDVSSQTSVTNVNPISELVTRTLLNGTSPSSAFQNPSPQVLANVSPTNLSTISQSLSAALQPLVVAKASTDSTLAAISPSSIAQALLSTPFNNNQNVGLDGFLDSINLTTDSSGNTHLTLTQAPSVSVVFSGNPQQLAQNVNQAITTFQNSSAQIQQALSAPPVTLILSAQSSWGTSSDSWAGYTGAAALYLPNGSSGGWSISFTSSNLNATSFWNTSARQNQSNFTLTDLGWNGTNPPNSILNFGYSGTSAVNSNLNITNCKFSTTGINTSCKVVFLDSSDVKQSLNSLVQAYQSYNNNYLGTISGSINTIFSSSQSAIARCASNSTANSNPGVSPCTTLTNTTGTSTSSSSSSSNGGTSSPTTSNSTPSNNPKFAVTFIVGSTWTNGYGGTISIKNNGADLPGGLGAWSFSVQVPKNFIQGQPYQFQMTYDDSTGTATFTPQSWTQPFQSSTVLTSGFNGSSILSLAQAQAPAGSNYTIVMDSSVGSAIAQQVAQAAQSQTNPIQPTPTQPTPTQPTPTQPVQVTPVAPVVPVGPSCIGSTSSTQLNPPSSLVPPSANFIFSPYKDVTINMNWNTNEITTKVTGSTTSVLNALPSNASTVTWAFATGTCAAENWGGIPGSALAAANVSKWVSAGKKYIISTGGAAGSFTCTSDADFIAFIKRYYSNNLVGIDFDIEAGQSQSDVDNLVQRALAAQTQYPNLRFTFTVATFGGNANPILGTFGAMVMSSIKKYNFQNAYINLMAMDYGSAIPSNCSVSNGVCEMGKSAVQAADSLHNQYNLPYSQIEVTPMIGGNDAIDETFTLANIQTLASAAYQHGLGGIHFWSLDRDTDCPPGYASPTCNTYCQAGTLGFTKGFLTTLGF